MREDAKSARKEKAEAAPTTLTSATKRKRSDVDEADPKLKEFLEVMQPASKANKWATSDVNDIEEPPTKMQALELPEGESDVEYEAVPKKPRKKSPPKEVPIAKSVSILPEPSLSKLADEPMPDANTTNATDDDWLRSRTNRLLDLMEPEDIVAGAVTSANTNVVAETSAGPTQHHDSTIHADEENIHEEPAEEEVEHQDPIIEAIKTNGRLFVRNLPYTASEDDIRQHFQSFGTLEEVWPSFVLSASSWLAS